MEEKESGRGSGMRRAWWWLIDRIDYASTLARLWLYDRIAGPEPATEADIVREHEKERLQRAFPDVDIDGIAPRGRRQRP